MSKRKYWLWTFVGFLIILFCALFLRLYRLDLIPVFADEAIYVRWAQVMRAEPSLRFLPLSDGKQPLFMWSIIPFLKILEDPLVAGRVVSVATGLGTTCGVFVLAYVLFKSRKVSLLASLLYALSPFAVFFDRMALVDSMLSFFGVWALIFMVQAIKELNLGLSLLSGFALGGALLTKSPALLFTLFLPLTAVFTPLKEEGGKLLSLAKAVGLITAALVVSYALYNILRLGENFHMIGSRNYDYVYPYGHILERPLDPLLPHLDRILTWFEVMGPAAVIILASLGALINFARYKKEIILLLVFGALPLFIQSEYAKVLTSRYFFFTLPPLVVLAASSLKKFKKTPQLYVVYTLVVFFFVQAILFYVPFFSDPARASWPEKAGYLADWTAGVGIKETAELIVARRDADLSKKIVVGTEGYFGTLPDGLQIYLEKEPNITVVGVGLDLKAVPTSLLESVAAGNVTFWVANASRLSFARRFEEYGLEVIASYEKTEDDKGQIDIFYVFEVSSDALGKL